MSFPFSAGSRGVRAPFALEGRQCEDHVGAGHLRRAKPLILNVLNGRNRRETIAGKPGVVATFRDVAR